MYPTPDISPHAVTVGREHPNHNYVEIAKGNPIVLRGLGNYGAEWNKISTTVRDVLIYTVPVYQQQFGNALKGAAFVFDLGTLCIAHLGDLAHKLTAEQVKAFGKVDIAMIPIGGSFTMPPDTRGFAATQTQSGNPDALPRKHGAFRYVRKRISK
jgi:L-ascorbate metabolism protein UlaG (beta-lactamase superfamily)